MASFYKRLVLSQKLGVPDQQQEQFDLRLTTGNLAQVIVQNGYLTESLQCHPESLS